MFVLEMLKVSSATKSNYVIVMKAQLYFQMRVFQFSPNDWLGIMIFPYPSQTKGFPFKSQ